MAQIQIDLQHLDPQDLQLEEQLRRQATELDPDVRAGWAERLFNRAYTRFALVLGIVFTLGYYYIPKLMSDLAIGVLVYMFYFRLSIIFAKHTQVDFTRIDSFILDSIGKWVYIINAIIVLVNLLIPYFLFYIRNSTLALLCIAIMSTCEFHQHLHCIQRIVGGRNQIFHFHDSRCLLIILPVRMISTSVCFAVVVTILVTHHDQLLMNLFLK